MDVIRHLYDECFKDSIILGVFMEGDFCGLAEIYGYREPKYDLGLLTLYWHKMQSILTLTDYKDKLPERLSMTYGSI